MGIDNGEVGKHYRTRRPKPAGGTGKRGSQLPDTTSGGVATEAVEPQSDPERIGVTWFLWQDDGWLRIVPDPDTLTVHIKWKFTEGPAVGRYVYVQGYPSDLDFLLSVLRHKIATARINPTKASPDHYYGGRRGQSDSGDNPTSE